MQMSSMHHSTAFAACAALVAASAGAAEPPVLLWSNAPAGPGETLFLGKSGACPSPCTISITPMVSTNGTTAAAPSSTTIDVDPALVSNASVMVKLPSTLPLGAYWVSAGGSSPLLVNAPTVWWVHGDGGSVSTAGGWVRAFGTALAVLPTPSTAAEDATLRLGVKAAATSAA